MIESIRATFQRIAVTMLSLSDLRPTLIARPGAARAADRGPPRRPGARRRPGAEIWTHMPMRASGGGFRGLVRSGARSWRWPAARRCGRCAPAPTAHSSAAPATSPSKPAHRRLEIGHTWYAPRVWASAGQPGLQARPAALRLRVARLQSGRAEDRQPQPPFPGRHRQAGRGARGRIPRPHGAPRRRACGIPSISRSCGTSGRRYASASPPALASPTVQAAE